MGLVQCHVAAVQVTAALTPVSDSQVDVQFKQFKILGLIPVTAPESAKGSLSVTFLDEEMRISRGDKGLFPPTPPPPPPPQQLSFSTPNRTSSSGSCKTPYSRFRYYSAGMGSQNVQFPSSICSNS
jgi:hypothetical protein